MSNFTLSCQCGNFQASINTTRGNHLVCYCKSCRRFAEQLGKGESFVDQYGGSRIYQIPPASFKIMQGEQELQFTTLTDQGPDRWHTKCCNTPICNTSLPALPFLAAIIPHQSEGELTGEVGPASFHVNTQGALRDLPSERSVTSTARFILRFVPQMLSWKLRGLHRPDPLAEARDNRSDVFT